MEETEISKLDSRKDGKTGRTLYRVKCDSCGNDVWKRKNQLLTYNNHFCNQACLYEYRKRRVTLPCGFCGKPVTITLNQFKKSKSGLIFCDGSCRTSFMNKKKFGEKHPNYKDGNSSYRRKGLRWHGARCQSPDCELRKAGIKVSETMLDVHHIDGDHNNSSKENLIVLCVWCHAKITRGLIDIDF